MRSENNEVTAAYLEVCAIVRGDFRDIVEGPGLRSATAPLPWPDSSDQVRTTLMPVAFMAVRVVVMSSSLN